MNYLPLQTHGLCKTVEVWLPPRDGRFVSYDNVDEAWMRPLGIGKVVNKPNPLLPVDLYDVRDENGDIVGYSELNPVDYWDRGSRDLRIAVIDTFPRPAGLFNRLADPFEELDTVREIRIRISTFSIGFDGPIGRDHPPDQRYLYWSVRLSDAPALIMGKWVKLIGEDNIKKFANEMHYRARELEYKRMYGR